MLLLIGMVNTQTGSNKWQNRYIEGKADEYSSKRTWSSISEQYPEGLTRGVIQYTRQKFRNQTTRQHEN